MLFEEAKSQVGANGFIRIKTWAPKERVRKSHLGDADYISLKFIEEGVLVRDCPKKLDCRITIFNPTAEESTSGDWEVIAGDAY